MKNLLYPAYHKLYNALYNLDKFEKNKNFFENINYLDNFFSEFRNITFVLQKSLAHTEFIDNYYHLRDRLLKNSTGKWLVDKRNAVVKECPFPLNKKIHITIFSPSSSIVVHCNIYTIDNDIEISELKEEIKSTFDSIESNEVFFFNRICIF
jgi:hypothetical protein